MKENMTGSPVLIPSESTGSAYMRIGVLTAIDLEKAEARVSFAAGGSADHSLSEIRTLKDKDALYRDLLTGSAEIDIGDFKRLFQVNMLQDRGNISALVDALILLKDSPRAVMAATESLDVKLNNIAQINPANQAQMSR